MKKTKLFTTLAALALVLGLGACDGGSSDEPAESGSTSEETSEPTTPSETDTLSNYTVAFSFVDEEGQATTIPEYATAYIVGDWDSWGEFLPLTEADGVYSYTFSSISVGTHAYKGVMYYSDETVTWNNCLEFITNEEGGDASLTISESEGDGYTQVIEWTLTNVLEEKPEPVVTYVISIYYDTDKLLDAAPEYINLYAAGDFNGTWNDTDTGWYDWGDPVALTNNGDGTYNFVLYELPEVDRSFEIIAEDTTDSTKDMWDYVVVEEYKFTSDDVNVENGAEKAITLTTTYTSWTEDGGVFPPLGEEEEEFYVAFINANTGDFTTYDLTFTADIDCWDGGSSVATHTTISDSHYAFYSGAGKSVSGATTNFTLSANGHSFKTNNAVTIPANTDGTPIYIGICWVDGWQADTTYTTWNVDTTIAAAGWQYIPSGTTVEAFLNSYTVSAYW